MLRCATSLRVRAHVGSYPVSGRALRAPRRQSAFMPWICQSVVTIPTEPPPVAAVPFMSHSTICPVVALLQSTSVLPSPLKSPVCATTHGLAATPAPPLPITLVPLMSQTTVRPLAVLYQRMSLLPSPSKSPVPAMVHGLAAVPADP